MGDDWIEGILQFEVSLEVEEGDVEDNVPVYIDWLFQWICQYSTTVNLMTRLLLPPFNTLRNLHSSPLNTKYAQPYRGDVKQITGM